MIFGRFFFRIHSLTVVSELKKHNIVIERVFGGLEIQVLIGADAEKRVQFECSLTAIATHLLYHG